MDTTVSVIGPDEAAARQVAAALGEVAGAGRHRIVVGAGPGSVAQRPGSSFGVVAVVPSPCTGEDARVVRAVVASVGGCVLYAESGGGGGDAAAGAGGADGAELGALAAEPGVVTVRWRSDAATDHAALTELAGVLDGMWVDVPRWIGDARRADADRADRVRIAVRLAAEETAAGLLDGLRSGKGGTTVELDAAFRARLTVAVLEQGVEMPHLADPAGTADPAGAADPTDSAGLMRPTGPDRSALVLSAVAAGGAALAAGVAVGRFAGGAAGTVVGFIVAAVVLLVRWRTVVAASRARGREAAASELRRRWTATVTDVVARMQVPSVATAVAEETGVRR